MPDPTNNHLRVFASAPELVGFDTYRATVSDAVVSLDVHTEHPEQFQGRLDAGTAGDIHVFDISADEHSVHRTPALVARAPQHYFKFTLIEHGGGLIVQEGRETALRAGDMTIYDTDKPYSLLFDDAVRMSIVMFPKQLLDIPAETLGQLTAVRLDGSTGVGAMIRPFVSSLAREVTEVDGHVARRLFKTAIEMVGTLLEANLANVLTTGAHDVLVRRIFDYIDDNLSAPQLNPAQIAAAHFISVRHLHALFSDQGTTVSTVIRTRRLERCYDDLVNPLRADRSVTAIALDSGFIDPAHFSRTFRAHFGVPPSTLRPARG
jgi:AraC-like DNA-binding protein